MNLQEKTVAIIGGGVAGLSIAHALKQASVQHLYLLEKDEEIALEASGKSSAMARHYHPDPDMLHVLQTAIDQLYHFQEQQTEPFFEQTPSLWLFDPEVKALLKGQNHPEWKECTTDNIPEQFHLEDQFPHNWISFPQDGLVDSVSLCDQLLQQLQTGPITLRKKTSLQSGSRNADGWTLQLDDGQTLKADLVVNAAGVWANEVAGKLGIESQKMHPVTRHLFYTHQQFVPPQYGYFWDYIHGFFFRRLEEGTLISCTDELPTDPGEPDHAEYPDDFLNNSITSIFPHLKSIDIDQYWGGQFMKTPDAHPIIGPDPEDPTFFWASGLNEFGITLSIWIGQRIKQIMTS